MFIQKDIYREIGVLDRTLQCNYNYTFVFLNFVILPLLLTSQRDFVPIQLDFAKFLETTNLFLVDSVFVQKDI